MPVRFSKITGPLYQITRVRLPRREAEEAPVEEEEEGPAPAPGGTRPTSPGPELGKVC